MTSTLRELQECPLCHHEYETRQRVNNHGKDLDRLPTSCRWCFHTICRACVVQTGLVCCPQCHKTKAFHATNPVVHDLSRRLLEQLQRFQTQQGEERGAFPTRISPVSLPTGANLSADDSVDPNRTAASLENGNHNNNDSNNAITPSPTLAERSFSPGTCVFRKGQWGTIQSSITKRLYALQYGDGDPHWVPFDDMKALVEAARRARRDNNDATSCFVGRHVYREFPGLGWYWGKVVDCAMKRFYTVIFATQQETMVPYEKILAWVDAAAARRGTATNDNGDPLRGMANRCGASGPTRAHKKRSVLTTMGHQASPKTSLLDDTHSREQELTPRDDAMLLFETEPPKKRRVGRPPKHPKPDSSPNGLTSDDDDMPISSLKKSHHAGLQIGSTLFLPEDDRGTGWGGFHARVSDDALPCKFRQVFQLMDFLFPVAPGEEPFVCLYDKPGNKGNGKPGSDVRWRLREIKRQLPNAVGLRWHREKARYVPPTKKDLAAFMDVLMLLDVAPEIENPDLRNIPWISGSDDAPSISSS